MGQYYKVVVGYDNGNMVYDTTVKNGEWNGMKLMEHSWWNNELLQAVGNEIYNSPKRIAWVGDYTETSDLRKLSKKAKAFTKAFVWGARSKTNQFNKSDFEFPTDDKQLYLVNYTNKEFIDLKYYYKTNNRNGWCINPIPLLTATSNGRGGGDYYKQYPDYNCCGSWAWDLLEITETVPEDYNEEQFNFIEE